MVLVSLSSLLTKGCCYFDIFLAAPFALLWPPSVIWRFRVRFLYSADSHTGGLECGSVQRHGVYLSMGSALLCCSYDIRQLRPLQSACGHLGGGISGRGEAHSWLLASLISERVAFNGLPVPVCDLFLKPAPSAKLKKTM